MRMLVSDMAGRASIELKGRELGYDLTVRSDGDRELLTRVTDRVKALEAAGWTFEAADAAFELLPRGGGERAGRAVCARPAGGGGAAARAPPTSTSRAGGRSPSPGRAGTRSVR